MPEPLLDHDKANELIGTLEGVRRELGRLTGGHPAIALLEQARDEIELTGIRNNPRRTYADYTPERV
ncbi:hypothetical protein [Nocardia sp. NPDC059239]|uniref:hypothetical protein n=1 Tax=unclassified Nocardia TaxID=2637762 RepID=UPI0036A6EA4F